MFLSKLFVGALMVAAQPGWAQPEDLPEGSAYCADCDCGLAPGHRCCRPDELSQTEPQLGPGPDSPTGYTFRTTEGCNDRAFVDDYTLNGVRVLNAVTSLPCEDGVCGEPLPLEQPPPFVVCGVAEYGAPCCAGNDTAGTACDPVLVDTQAPVFNSFAPAAYCQEPGPDAEFPDSIEDAGNTICRGCGQPEREANASSCVACDCCPDQQPGDACEGVAYRSTGPKGICTETDSGNKCILCGYEDAACCPPELNIGSDGCYQGPVGGLPPFANVPLNLTCNSGTCVTDAGGGGGTGDGGGSGGNGGAPSPSSGGSTGGGGDNGGDGGDGAVPLYGQCGGQYHTGGTTCRGAAECIAMNPYYSQCVLPTSGPATEGVQLYEQCGGQGYSGPTECAFGAACVSINEWYAQCRLD